MENSNFRVFVLMNNKIIFFFQEYYSLLLWIFLPYYKRNYIEITNIRKYVKVTVQWFQAFIRTKNVLLLSRKFSLLCCYEETNPLRDEIIFNMVFTFWCYLETIFCQFEETTLTNTASMDHNIIYGKIHLIWAENVIKNKPN